MADKQDDPEIQRLLSGLGRELASRGSIVPDIRRSITGTAMRPVRGAVWYGTAAVAAILLTATMLLLKGKTDPSPPPPGQSLALATSAEVQFNGLTVAEHLSLALDADAVLVAWTCRGGRPTEAADFGQRKYTEHTLRRERLADGRELTWSLFVARPEVLPVLQPPSMQVASADGRLLLLTATPRTATFVQAEESIRSTRLPGRPRLMDIRALIDQNRSQRPTTQTERNNS